MINTIKHIRNSQKCGAGTAWVIDSSEVALLKNNKLLMVVVTLLTHTKAVVWSQGKEIAFISK